MERIKEIKISFSEENGLYYKQTIGQSFRVGK